MVVLVVEERCHFDVKTALDWEDKVPGRHRNGWGRGRVIVVPCLETKIQRLNFGDAL